MIATLFTLLPLLSAPCPPAQGPLAGERSRAAAAQDYADLLTEYKKAALGWRRAERAAKKAGELDGFDTPHPVHAYFERFEALAATGNANALLWTALNVEDTERKRKEVAQLKRRAFERLATEFVDHDAVKGMVQKLSRQDRWLAAPEIQGLLHRVYDKSRREELRAAAGLELGEWLEQRGSDADLAKARSWYQRVTQTFPRTNEAVKAQKKLDAQRTAVGMIAPDFAAEDVDGRAFKLSDYRGKVVVLDFWGFW